MYYNFNTNDECSNNQEILVWYSRGYTILFWTFTIGILCGYFFRLNVFNIDVFNISVWGWLILLVVNFIVIIARVIRLHRGYWFPMVCLFIYACAVSEYIVLNQYLQDKARSFFYTFICFIFVDILSTYIQIKLKKLLKL